MRAQVDEADREEQLQELEVLQSMYQEDLTVLDEEPLRLELAVPLDAGGPRLVLARGGSSTSGARTAGGAGFFPECGCGDDGEASAPEPSAHSAPSAPRAGRKLQEFVPGAVQMAEEALDARDTGEGDADWDPLGVQLSHLPPLALRVALPAGYPSRRPPELQLSAQWLSGAQLAGLCAELDRLAEGLPGQAVVWAWADWLQTSALAFLGLDGGAPLVLEAAAAAWDARALSELDDPMEVLRRLRRFDREHGWWTWQQTAQSCGICLEEKPGSSFCEFAGCRHRFCAECVSGMMQVHISEGTVTSVRCPLPDCRGEVGPRLVKQLVDQGLYQRWRRLQVQKILSETASVVYCPRCETNGLETPVLPEGDEQPGELPLAVCDRPNCLWPFCAACREPYHPNTHCTAMTQRLERLGLQSRMAGDKSRTRRQQLLEELQSLKYILSETVPCPKCKMPITRSQGCNHMACTNCTTHFCYRCGVDITAVGYNHFRADKCPTFDREEVERINHAAFGREEALEEELEELRRQYPDQAGVVWNFRPPPGAWRRAARRRQAADVACNSCGQWNPRTGTNNHVRCRFCKTNFCYQCKAVIRGVVNKHFKPPSGCPQHSQ